MTEASRVMAGQTLVAVLGLAGFISAADNWIVSPVLPAIAAGLGVSIPMAGIVFTAYMVPYGSYECVLEDIDGRWIGIGRVKQREVFFGDADA